MSNTFDTAIDLGTITTVYESGEIIFHENTYYKFTIENDGNSDSYVEMNYDASVGDLDLQLFNSDRQYVKSSASTSGNEKLTFFSMSAGTYYIRVFVYRGKFNIWAGTPQNIAKPVSVMVGVNGIARPVTEIYVGVDNKAKKIGGVNLIPYRLKIVIDTKWTDLGTLDYMGQLFFSTNNGEFKGKFTLELYKKLYLVINLSPLPQPSSQYSIQAWIYDVNLNLIETKIGGSFINFTHALLSYHTSYYIRVISKQYEQLSNMPLALGLNDM
jgi:hypothetical protein